jgi:AAA+ superfamily predicted ATPase
MWQRTAWWQRPPDCWKAAAVATALAALIQVPLWSRLLWPWLHTLALTPEARRLAMTAQALSVSFAPAAVLFGIAFAARRPAAPAPRTGRQAVDAAAWSLVWAATVAWAVVRLWGIDPVVGASVALAAAWAADVALRQRLGSRGFAALALFAGVLYAALHAYLGYLPQVPAADRPPFDPAWFALLDFGWLPWIALLAALHRQAWRGRGPRAAALPLSTAPRHAEGPFGAGEPVRVRRPDSDPAAFDRLVGMEAVITRLKDAVETPLLHPERVARYGLRPEKGLLLSGPPGTVKTALARAAAAYFGCAFFYVGPGELTLGPGVVGSVERKVAELFADARRAAPAILFFDELDAVGARRDGEHRNRPQDLVLPALLAEIDGFDPLEGVVLLGATNAPELLDPALVRHGRFGPPIPVPPPDLAGRAALFRVFLRGRPCAGDVDPDELARRTGGWVGASIEAAVEAAARAALKRGIGQPERDRIEMADLLAAIDEQR